MTLIITAIAALLTALLCFRNPQEAKEWHLGTLALIYVGAVLMWCVDGFASVAEGGAFLELSDTAQMMDDMLLGICVVVLGAVAWGLVVAVKRRNERARS